MNSLDKLLTTNIVFSHAVAEALIAKGLISKQDLQNAVTMLGYDAPLAAPIEEHVRLMIQSLPGDSSS